MKRGVFILLVAFFGWLHILTIISAQEKEHAGRSVEKKHWTAPPVAAKRPNPIPRTKASVDSGKMLFQKHCALCHGSGGRGNGPLAAKLSPRPADLAKMAGHHPDGDIAWKIANGRGTMPAWKGTLSAEEIWHLTNFIQNLKGQPHSH